MKRENMNNFIFMQELESVIKIPPNTFKEVIPILYQFSRDKKKRKYFPSQDKLNYQNFISTREKNKISVHSLSEL